MFNFYILFISFISRIIYSSSEFMSSLELELGCFEDDFLCCLGFEEGDYVEGGDKWVDDIENTLYFFKTAALLAIF